MKKFMAIYMAPAAMIQQMMQNSTPEQMKAGMDEWTKWSDANEGDLIDLGTPLGKTKRITGTGVADAKNDMTGYSIVEAETADDAAAIFKDHPHLKMGSGASIELIECVNIEDMM